MDNQHPPVKSYNVYHNVTSSDGHMTVHDTHYVANVLRGYTYYFIVSANNVIGEGDNTTLILNLPTVTVTTPSETVTSTLNIGKFRQI